MSTKKKKTFQYSQKLQKSLEKFGESCNEIATLALQYDLHETHVAQITEFSKNRVAELKKQVEQKRPSSVVELLDVDDDDGETKKEVKEPKDEKKKELASSSTQSSASSDLNKPSSSSPTSSSSSLPGNSSNSFNKPNDQKSNF